MMHSRGMRSMENLLSEKNRYSKGRDQERSACFFFLGIS